MQKLFLVLIIILHASYSIAQTSGNPAITNIRVDGEFNPGFLSEPQQALPSARTAPSANPAARVGINSQQQGNNPFVITVKDEEGNNTEEEVQPQIIQSDNPFDIKKLPVPANLQNGYHQQQQVQNPAQQQEQTQTQPFDNYKFTQEKLTQPDVVNYGTNSLEDTNSELYRRANNPNQVSETPNFQYKERKESCDNNGDVCVIYYVSDERILVELINNSPATRTASLTIWNTNSHINMKVRDPKRIIIKGGEKIQVTEIVRESMEQDFGFNVTSSSTEGFAEAIHNDNYVYALPFEPGKSFKMVQGYGGNFSHNDDESYFSYDFRMPTGTPIFASREGVVIGVRTEYSRGGIDERLVEKANDIRIEHEDGTIGVYAHLMQNGATVKVGEYVQKGQKIGYSGDTGYSGSPHLHFSVVKYRKDGTLQSVAIKMQTKKGVLERLQDNEYYMR